MRVPAWLPVLGQTSRHWSGRTFFSPCVWLHKLQIESGLVYPTVGYSLSKIVIAALIAQSFLPSLILACYCQKF
jgi:hypothetical protein